MLKFQTTRAKAAAASSGVSLKEYVIAALELATKASEAAQRGKKR
jgi:predicted HicB family RNase H-like nuclease